MDSHVGIFFNTSIFTRILAHTVVLEHSQILPNFNESFFLHYSKKGTQLLTFYEIGT